MAIALKNAGQEALAAGWETAGSETLKMLCHWADAIVVMQGEVIAKLQEKVGKDDFDYRKIIVVDVGPDVFGTPFHPALLSYLKGIAQDWKRKGFALDSAVGHRLPLVKP